MPIVKQSWVKTPEALEKYLEKDRGAETITTASDGLSEEMAKAIRNEHEKHRKNVKNLALTIIQSWPEKESNLLSPEKYNEMGLELAKRIAPGHLSWVVTHTEKNHIHNHIVICAVNSETGKQLTNKRSEIRKLHEANNAIARENGFAVLEPKVKAFEARLPQKVRSMVARGKESWLFDLSQKADFSRAASTSFDEYVGTLKGLGIDARVEDKNISYFYGDHKKAIRGKRLGKNFDKDGLMKAFKENDERFTKNPELMAQMKSANFSGAPKKDYNQFTKIDRKKTREELPAIFDKRGGVLYQEMMNARKTSLLDYCDRNKIKLTTNEKGQTVLRGKEFVIFKSPSEWTNTKNGTSGTIIDFVAIHDETNYLRAVAKINNNPRLLLLEQSMGEYKRGYQAFHIPKPQAAPAQLAAQTLNKFFNARGIRGEAAQTLMRSKSVHVGKDASVWLMGEKTDSAFEFREETNGKWQAKRHGKANGGFFEMIGKSKQMSVFCDPFEFISAKEKGSLSHQNNHSVFVMFDEHSKGKLDEILALNPHISEVKLIHSGKEPNEKERRTAHEMKTRFNPFDIHIKELSLADSGKERSQGPDISI